MKGFGKTLSLGQVRATEAHFSANLEYQALVAPDCDMEVDFAEKQSSTQVCCQNLQGGGWQQERAVVLGFRLVGVRVRTLLHAQDTVGMTRYRRE